MEPQSRSNDDQAQYWNGPESSHWLVHEHRYERMLAPFARLVLGAAAVGRTDHVLDVGCGTGSTTCTAACGGFDVAISRFGVMFFSDTRAACANLARGLRPGGRLVFVCWQGLVDNEWATVPAVAAAQHIPLPSLNEPGSPGPFSLSDRHHLAAVLDAAGLLDVAIEPVAEPLWLGRDVADTVEFFKASGIGQTLLRNVDLATSTRVMAAVQAALEAHLTSDGVRLASRAWLLTARNPR
jgi:SAM-dependent methyltransferase